MSRCFLENLSLSSLVAPTNAEEFRALYWERQPLIIHRKDPDFYGDLFTLRDFDEAIARSPDYVKTANATTEKNVSYRTAGSQGLESILTQMRSGGTLILDQHHHREPKLGLLCRVMATEVGHRFQANLYLTPAKGRGFLPHWDNHDVFILQVVGSKHWTIEKDRRIYPAKLDSMGDDGRELRGELDSFVQPRAVQNLPCISRSASPACSGRISSLRRFARLFCRMSSSALTCHSRSTTVHARCWRTG